MSYSATRPTERYGQFLLWLIGMLGSRIDDPPLRALLFVLLLECGLAARLVPMVDVVSAPIPCCWGWGWGWGRGMYLRAKLGKMWGGS